MRRELRFGAAPRAAGVRSTALAMRSRATCVKSSAMSGERRRLKYARNNGRNPPSNRERLPITALCPADAFGQQLRIRIPVLRVRHPATTTPLESRGHRPGATCRRRRRHWCRWHSRAVATNRRLDVWLFLSSASGIASEILDWLTSTHAGPAPLVESLRGGVS